MSDDGQTAKRKGGRVALVLGAISLLMFALGFALAPLYSMLCEALGLQTASAAVVSAQRPAAVTSSRLVTVRFDTNVPADLPWEFSAEQVRLAVHPGASSEMRFHVRNRSAQTIVGRAIPTIVPWQAAAHFAKTECFCFQDQAIAPGESKELIVRFIVSPQLPDDIDALTLSYTFMRRAADADTAATVVPTNSKG